MKGVITTTIVCAVIVFVSGLSGSAQTKKPPLAPPTDCGRRNTIVYEGDMGHLLASVAAEYKTVVGFEAIPYMAHRTIRISACFTTMEEIVKVILDAAPEYQWETADGVISVYPKESPLTELLNSVLPGFEVSNADWAGAMQAIANAIASTSQTTRIALNAESVSPDQYAGVPLVYFSMSLKDVTIRRALNEITKKSGNTFWTLQMTGATARGFVIKNSMR